VDAGASVTFAAQRRWPNDLSGRPFDATLPSHHLTAASRRRCLFFISIFRPQKGRNHQSMDRLLDLIAADPYANAAAAPSQLGRRRLKTRAPGMPSMPPMMSTLIDKPPNCHVSAITSDSINRIIQIISNWTRSHGIISAPFFFYSHLPLDRPFH
jgi:hypothetical protein